MTTRVMVLGAQGKMGQEACRAIENDPRFSLAAKLGRDSDLGQYLESTPCDVVVELTNARSVMKNTIKTIEHQKPIVVGASGLSETDIERLTSLAKEKKVGVIIAPNFSIGAILMMHFAEQTSSFMEHAEIIEAHHPGKIDAPSGTALKTAAMLAPHFDAAPGTEANTNQSRGLTDQTIPIHSLRMAGVIADQAVIFGNPGEQLRIEHKTLDRKAFMPGLLLACEHARKIHHLVYGLESLVIPSIDRNLEN